MYEFVKTVHVVCALISICGFMLRGVWMLKASSMLTRRWVKIVPHINDTLLLASAIALAVMAGFSPMGDPWLGAKVAALLVYIGLGSLALRPGRSRAVRAAAFGGALLVFIYIALVAVTKTPLPVGG